MSRDLHQQAAPARVRVALLTISDTRTPVTDQSAHYLQQHLTAAGHHLSAYRIVRDDMPAIRAAICELLPLADVLITTGGTGIAGRDQTIPVVEALLTKPMPGFGELFRALSYPQVGAAAMLSRAVGGLAAHAAGHTLLFALPGSLNAVQTAWEGIFAAELGHLVYEVQRQGQPAAPAKVTNATGENATGEQA